MTDARAEGIAGDDDDRITTDPAPAKRHSRPPPTSATTKPEANSESRRNESQQTANSERITKETGPIETRKPPPPDPDASVLPSVSIDKTRHLFSRLESRSLSELTRQIAPPTKNGHAPPPTESRKSSQSVNPPGVWTW